MHSVEGDAGPTAYTRKSLPAGLSERSAGTIRSWDQRARRADVCVQYQADTRSVIVAHYMRTGPIIRRRHVANLVIVSILRAAVTTYRRRLPIGLMRPHMVIRPTTDCGFPPSCEPRPPNAQERPPLR